SPKFHPACIERSSIVLESARNNFRAGMVVRSVRNFKGVSMSRKSEFSSLSLLCVVVLLAAAMSSAQTAPSQDADPNAAQAATQSGAATIAPSGPLMASSKAQRREDKLAARSQFLAQWK